MSFECVQIVDVSMGQLLSCCTQRQRDDIFRDSAVKCI